MNISNILVAVDGSNNSVRAVDAAAYLAKSCDAKVTAVYVVPFGARLAFEGINRAAKEAFFKEGKKHLAAAQKKLKSKGVSSNTKVLEGRNPGNAIVTHSNRKPKYDLIMLGSRGIGGLKEAFLGSVSSYVLHKSKVPVMVVK